MTNDQKQPGKDPRALRRLARDYHRAGKYLAALESYDRLIGWGWADAEVWRETGNTLMDVGEYAQAQDAFRNSLELEETNAESHNNRSRALYRLGDLDAALDHLRRAIALSDSLNAWQNLATMIPACPTATLGEIRQVRETFARKLARHAPPARLRPAKARPGTPLRVGYVSSFFHAANYMKPVWGLINHHDRGNVAIHLLTDSPVDKGLPGYQPNSADRIHPTSALDNEALLDLVGQLELDILVDLNGYSTPERLGLFLVAPGPTTVTWFNSYATTGLPGIQYLIGDGEVVRQEEEPFFSETIVRLPLSYLTFDVTHPVPPVAPSPCASTHRLTFGSLVTQYKITSIVLDAWSEILRKAPDARLLLANTALKSPQNREYVLEQFTRRGVAPAQLVLREPADHYRYLQYYDQIDVALDAFPYNGGTTTMEALWQGVPVLTFDGDRWASRTSQTLIRRTPWGRFVAPDVRGYIEQAVQLATSRESRGELSEIRFVMREQLAQSSACDTPRLAASMETIYRELAERGQRR